ncbi:hypothetical protein FJY84_06165, partial [Candidatus Bathyarchaeota archaeon]|nr:hypothetical protein [Candidatus Bathyarchaeota archaeon]
LGLGKVSKEIFNRSVLPYISINDVGLDGTIVKLTEKIVIAHSPSIGVPPEPLGFFAFHYAASNVACKFGKPSHLITGIYLPLKTKEKDLKIIAKTLGNEAKKFDVKIVAGQTATYSGLEIPFITTTCLGEQIKTPERSEPGDYVILIGEIGKEAVWLKKLSENISSNTWKKLTPLPIIFDLQKIDGIKLMHDVSEGGVKGALFEVTQSLSLGLDFCSKNVKYAKNANEIPNVLSAPTYGVIVVVVKSSSVELVKTVCNEKNIPYTIFGALTKNSDFVLDGEKVTKQERIALDELYGSFRKSSYL